MSTPSLLSFPPNFTWGAATAAYQIEGAWDEDGRSPSIWDTFVRRPGKIYRGDTGDVAADHYHRWPQDVQIMVELGLKAYRFSVSWSRVLPEGRGEVNQAGLDFYDRLVDALLAHGIQPFVTLFHYDLPQVLQDQGGWADRETANRFAEYAAILAQRLGDRVTGWITHNEPEVVAMNGHYTGEHAPGLQDPFIALRVAYNLIVSHGLALQALRAALPASAQVGITLNINPVYPASASEIDRLAARRVDTVLNRLFIEPVMHGRFPPEAEAIFHQMLPEPQPGDFEAASAPLDFLGLNYYTRLMIRHDPEVPLLEASQVLPEGNEYSQMWEIYPQSLYELLHQIWQDYRPANIYITENGVPVPDGIDFDGRVRDERRIRYLHDHLFQAHRALSDGIPLRGYFVWSLIDNFEWAHGYRMRFGLVYVDYENELRRTIKDSGRWYARVIRQNGLALT